MMTNSKDNNEERIRSNDEHFSSGAGPGKNSNELKNTKDHIDDEKGNFSAEFNKKYSPKEPGKGGIIPDAKDRE